MQKGADTRKPNSAGELFNSEDFLPGFYSWSSHRKDQNPDSPSIPSWKHQIRHLRKMRRVVWRKVRRKSASPCPLQFSSLCGLSEREEAWGLALISTVHALKASSSVCLGQEPFPARLLCLLHLPWCCQWLQGSLVQPPRVEPKENATDCPGGTHSRVVWQVPN